MVAVVAPLATLTTPACTPAVVAREPAVVVHAVDGDTVDVRPGSGGGAGPGNGAPTRRVRLIGVDTPETKRPGTPVECFGPEAAAHLAEVLAPGTPVELEHDTEARDRYGRDLAYLHRTDGTFVNLQLVQEGYGAVSLYPPNLRYAGEMTRADDEARADHRGLWGQCGAPHRPVG